MEDEKFRRSFLPGDALHEAGHVVVDLHYGVTLDFATLEPNADYPARVHAQRKKYSVLWSEPDEVIREYATAACAGFAAEAIDEERVDFFEDEVSECFISEEQGMETDFDRLKICLDLLLIRFGDDDPEKWSHDFVSPFDILFEETWNNTIEILRSHWSAVLAIRKSLLKHETLAGEQLQALYEQESCR